MFVYGSISRDSLFLSLTHTRTHTHNKYKHEKYIQAVRRREGGAGGGEEPAGAVHGGDQVRALRFHFTSPAMWFSLHECWVLVHFLERVCVCVCMDGCGERVSNHPPPHPHPPKNEQAVRAGPHPSIHPSNTPPCTKKKQQQAGAHQPTTTTTHPPFSPSKKHNTQQQQQAVRAGPRDVPHARRCPGRSVGTRVCSFISLY